MKAEEKATELVMNFIPYTTNGSDIEIAKILASIAVDDIIELRLRDLQDPDLSDIQRENLEFNINYYLEVKQHITNL